MNEAHGLEACSGPVPLSAARQHDVEMLVLPFAEHPCPPCLSAPDAPVVAGWITAGKRGGP